METPKEWTSKGLDEPLDNPRPTNLIVNYLPNDTSDEEFYDLFATFGSIRSSKVVRDNSGICVGYGFVDFVIPRCAAVAQVLLNGRQLRAKNIKVAFALPRSRDIGKCNLFVKFLPTNVDVEELENLFGEYGRLWTVKIMPDKFNGLLHPPLNVAYVRFRLPADAEKARIGLDGYRFPNAKQAISIKTVTAPRRENPRENQAEDTAETRSPYEEKEESKLVPLVLGSGPQGEECNMSCSSMPAPVGFVYPNAD